jgi:hypothetical protein
MKCVAILLVFITANCIYAAKGDIVSQFILSSQPVYGVKGLEYDPYDGNIWCAGPDDENDVIFGKFDSDSHAIVQNWQKLQGQDWCLDIGYKYVYNGKDCIVACDVLIPRYKLYNKTDGSYVGSLPDAFSGAYDGGISGDYRNNWGVTLYATNYGSINVMKWDGSSWTNWVTCFYYARGCCYGWAHVFIIHSSPAYKITSIRIADSSSEEDILLNNWGNCYMIGLARGRDNYDGKDDTLYTACYYPSNFIREIDIGNYNQTEITSISIGSIKALFH